MDIFTIEHDLRLDLRLDMDTGRDLRETVLIEMENLWDPLKWHKSRLKARFGSLYYMCNVLSPRINGSNCDVTANPRHEPTIVTLPFLRARVWNCGGFSNKNDTLSFVLTIYWVTQNRPWNYLFENACQNTDFISKGVLNYIGKRNNRSK